MYIDSVISSYLLEINACINIIMQYSQKYMTFSCTKTILGVSSVKLEVEHTIFFLVVYLPQGYF